MNSNQNNRLIRISFCDHIFIFQPQVQFKKKNKSSQKNYIQNKNASDFMYNKGMGEENATHIINLIAQLVTIFEIKQELRA